MSTKLDTAINMYIIRSEREEQHLEVVREGGRERWREGGRDGGRVDSLQLD